MTLSALKLKKLTAAIGTCLVLGASGPMLADTDLIVENDGLMLSAFVSSSDVVLSMSVRIIGPDGFVLEKRVEDSVVNWIPEGELTDGIYHWEAWTVTAVPGAQPRDFMLDQSMNQPDVSALGGAQIQSDPIADLSQDDIPVERFFRSQDKQVIRESGSFRVKSGWLEELKENQDDFVSLHVEPTGIQRLVGALLDRLIPTAHAQTFTSNITISKTFPTLAYSDSGADSTDSSQANIAYFDEQMRLRIRYGTGIVSGVPFPLTTTPIAIQRGAANNSIFIRGGGGSPTGFGSGFVGMGTNTPSEPLHMSNARPAIRLESTLESQSWYVRNNNLGRFEVSSRSIVGESPFTIAPPANGNEADFQGNSLFISNIGFVGIGTNDPGGFALDIQRNFFGATVIGMGRVGSPGRYALQAGAFLSGSPAFSISEAGGGTPFRMDAGAPTNSLRIAANGNVGLGTANPEFSFNIVSNNGQGQVRITETNGSNGLTMFAIENTGHPRFRLRNSALDSNWDFRTAGSGSSEQFQITNISDGQSRFPFRLFKSGNLEVEGTVTANGVLLTSSRDTKTDFAPLDAQDVLQRLSSLEISQWRYKNQEEGTFHYGPIAEEFHEIFGLSNGTHLNVIDTNGIAFAAIQALHTQNTKLHEENQSLMQRLERLEQAIDI